MEWSWGKTRQSFSTSVLDQFRPKCPIITQMLPPLEIGIDQEHGVRDAETPYKPRTQPKVLLSFRRGRCCAQCPSH